jgi:protein tyrosine/serine phosphatase
MIETEVELDPLYPPHRFNMIDNSIYRGAYPVLPNYRFLSRLQLKTILSLVPEPPTEDLKQFCELASINIIHIPVSRAILLADAQSYFTSALEVMLSGLLLFSHFIIFL